MATRTMTRIMLKNFISLFTNKKEKELHDILYKHIIENDLLGAALRIRQIRNINRSLKGSTPLGWATIGGDLAIIQMLLDAGADPNTCGTHTDPPLHLALKNDRPDIFRLLVQNGANLNFRNSLKNHFIDSILYNSGHLKFLQILVEENVDLLRHGISKMHIAAIFGDIEQTRKCIEEKFDHPSLYAHRKNPIFFAQVYSHKKVLELLVKYEKYQTFLAKYAHKTII